jgi:alpha-glucosidase
MRNCFHKAPAPIGLSPAERFGAISTVVRSRQQVKNQLIGWRAGFEYQVVGFGRNGPMRRSRTPLITTARWPLSGGTWVSGTAEGAKLLQEAARPGVVGAIDFFDHEHRQVRPVSNTAERRGDIAYAVNFHAPTSRRANREPPNELIREGVRVLSRAGCKARAIHNTTLPFTRYLAGTGDYTPVHFGSTRDTTATHQIATAAAPRTAPDLRAHPKRCRTPRLKHHVSPADKTIALEPSRSRTRILARRSGKVRFLPCSLTANRMIQTLLKFLMRGLESWRSETIQRIHRLFA